MATQFRRILGVPLAVALVMAISAPAGAETLVDGSGDVPEVVQEISQAVDVVGAEAPVANSGLMIPEDSADPTTAETDTGTFELSVPSSQKGSATPTGVLYPGEAEHTWVLVEPLRYGVRALVHIDSPESPERFAFDVDGDVAALELNQDGSVNGYGAEGQLIAQAATPWAVDAEGREVPTHFEIDGTTLVQVIEHQGGDWTYGITADPSWVWWTQNIAKCAAGVAATLSAVGAPVKIAKITKILKKNPKLKKALDKAGGLKQFLKDLLKVARERSKVSPKVFKRVKEVMLGGGGLILTVISGGCGNLADELF